MCIHTCSQDDPIDTAILAAFDTQKAEARLKNDASADDLEVIKPFVPIHPSFFKLQKFYPFDPTIKRSTAQLLHRPTNRKLIVSKGLVEKVFNTGDNDDAGGSWVCAGGREMKEKIMAMDMRLSKKGYKTLGVVSGFSV